MNVLIEGYIFYILFCDMRKFGVKNNINLRFVFSFVCNMNLKKFLYDWKKKVGVVINFSGGYI